MCPHAWSGGHTIPKKDQSVWLAFLYLRRWGLSLLERYSDETGAESKLHGAQLSLFERLTDSALNGTLSQLLDLRHTDEGVTVPGGYRKSSGFPATEEELAAMRTHLQLVYTHGGSDHALLEPCGTLSPKPIYYGLYRFEGYLGIMENEMETAR